TCTWFGRRRRHTHVPAGTTTEPDLHDQVSKYGCPTRGSRFISGLPAALVNANSAPFPTIQAIVVRDRRILNRTIRDPYYKRGHGIPRLRSPGRGGGRAMTDQHVACEFSAPPEPATPPAPAAPVARPRVLVIDDEAAIRSALGDALAAEGLVTDLAETAADGLSRARADVYDLVILDLLMPGTEGFAVLRQLLPARPGQTVRGL